MVTASSSVRSPATPRYAGLRLSADEYLALPDDGFRYQVVNGVVLMSPSPTPRHQKIVRLILLRLAQHVDSQSLGEVFHETDVRFAADLVYRPDIVYYSRDRLQGTPERLSVPPDLAIEVLSPGTEAMDLTTKRDDYARFGVREYWAVDGDSGSVHCFRLRAGKYEHTLVERGTLASEAAQGFTVNLADLRIAKT